MFFLFFFYKRQTCKKSKVSVKHYGENLVIGKVCSSNYSIFVRMVGGGGEVGPLFEFEW